MNQEKPSTDSIWSYKDQKYIVLHSLDTEIIQYNNTWQPLVRYTTHNDITGLIFYRSLEEWNQKFIPVNN